MSAAPTVDLVVNCWERDFRTVLADGFFAMLAAQSGGFAFAGRVALINNVDDLADARARAERLVASGELTAYVVVEERLDIALRTAGLTRADIERAPHYTDCSLVAVTAEGSPWVVYWDAEVRLRDPVDWITPAVELMERDRRVLVANPNAWHHPEPSAATVETAGDFALGYGFSDQLYLARRADLARPIYGERHTASLRYPLAHVTPTFEQRLDSHMRRNGLLRASHLRSAYEHPPATAGASYPGSTRADRVRRRAYNGALSALRVVPPRLRPATLRDV